MLNNNPYLMPTQQPLLNPITSPVQPRNFSTLLLNQIENFDPVLEFIDAANTKWSLLKAASNSTIDIPDPKTIQIVDYWNHAFPGTKPEVYIYVVEGVKQPRVETEKPMRVMYQWFSSRFVPNFNPQMITDKEWLKANVYSASFGDTRISQLTALCKLNGPVAETPTAEDKLIQVEEFNNAKPAERPAN